MPSFWKAFSHTSSHSHSARTNSSPASSSSPAYESPRGGSDRHLFGGGGGQRLTRQPRLRHATEDELGLRLGLIDGQSKSKSLPVSPESNSRLRRHAGHWSESALPQPLPLPKQNSEGESLLTKGQGHTSSSAATSNPSRDGNGKAVNSTRRATTQTYRRRGFYDDHTNTNKDRLDSFRLEVPARSAPGSGFTSPVLSPKKFSTVDIFNPAFLHSKSHLENNLNVHPLPLPPGVLRLSPSCPTHNNTEKSAQSCPTHNNAEKSDTPLPTKGLWQKRKLLGRGTYGTVYVASNCETGALCAMKEVEYALDDPKALECIQQLEQEIQVLRQLKHPNIVQYYGSEIVDDRFCIYLEYINPGSLNKYLRDYGGALPESVVRNFTRHIVSGMAYLHSTKTIHRDIKGANLLVDASGVVKLADFGLAKHLSGKNIDLSLKGSPHWMAPEVMQAVLRKDDNPYLALAVDIWSLGCTVIEMFTGQPPWSDLSWVQAMFSVLNKSPPIPETLSSEGKHFIGCCLQRNPADRPSAAMLLDHPFLHLSPASPFQHDTQQDLMKHQQLDQLNATPSIMHLKLLRSSHGDIAGTHPPNSEANGAVGGSRHHSPRSTLEHSMFTGS
ncbi:unnamed protein product [Cuscuta epithymum]|uniref:mitogen-activated protein kinase kinase kinase n=1 Tax=Cuscuta epithymum TaxID=186058 RepID=A0AAV0DKK1_9ASTE|nr:unnamed protein product [Cuscuta epithymum]